MIVLRWVSNLKKEKSIKRIKDSFIILVQWVSMRFIQCLKLISGVKSEEWAMAKQTWSIHANYSDSLTKKFITPPVISVQGGHELSRSGVCNLINYQQKGFGQDPCSLPHWGQVRQNGILFYLITFAPRLNFF